jgi:glycosyltransferase involved in cell wall biosynthesis
MPESLNPPRPIEQESVGTIPGREPAAQLAATSSLGNTPTVSIGMPVYNGEKFIREALDSLLVQTFTDFELIISDNASTDATELICREYAARDLRIYYVRHEVNRGAPANFQFVLDKARGKYFMWAAADDVRSPDFIEKNYCFLENNQNFVASTCPVKFRGGEYDPCRMGDGPLIGEFEERISNFFTSWRHANGRFYSLIKREVVKKCPYVSSGFLGSDWAVVVFLASKGNIGRIDQGFIILGREGVSNSKDFFRICRKKKREWIFPFYELFCVTLSLTKGIGVREKVRLWLFFARLNSAAACVNLIREGRRMFRLSLPPQGSAAGNSDNHRVP